MISRYLDIEVITTMHKKIIPRRKTFMEKKSQDVSF